MSHGELGMRAGMEPAAATQARILCPKCLPGGPGKEAFLQDLQRYVDRISPDERAGDERYRERLSLCGSCDQLQEGMCRVCGCYVQLRAAMKGKACPLVHPRWLGEGE